MVKDIVQIPKSDQNCEDCKKAKHEELDKLKQFNTYDEVADTGQFQISTTWALCKKEDVARACLVAQGYEELEPIKKVCPLSAGMVFVPSYLLNVIMSGMFKQQISNLHFFRVNPLKDVYIDPPKKARVKDDIICHLNTALQINIIPLLAP